MKQSHPIESERQNNNRSHLAVSNASPVSQAFVDNRESTALQRQLMAKMANSPQVIAQRKLSEQMNNSPRMLVQRQQIAKMSGNAVQRMEGEEELLQGKFKTIQRVEEEELLQGKFGVAQRVEEEELMQGKFAPVQRVEEEELLQGKFDTAQRVEEEELLQGKFDTVQLVQASTDTEKANNTGLPDNLKQGIENLSGMSMDNVKVHYNSSKPAQLNALAYAQGTDIHLGAGQEKHLPHEAWHVVQQAQGRVKPTMQMREGVPVNDDQALEHEADVMGAKAVDGVVQARQESGVSIESDSIGFMGGKEVQRQATHQKGCGCAACTGGTIKYAPMQTKPVVQRFCGVPGCKDPKCDNTENHNISNFRRLRNVDIYNADRDKSNLGKGSGTNQGTRNYVQDPNSFYPEEVSLSYTNEDSSYQGRSSYVQPPRTSGMKPDAGHIFGNQYGGSGKDTANIFAQEPKHNRGNRYKGKRTFKKWRKTENEIRRGIGNGYRIRATAKLYRKQRRKYDPNTISDEAYREFMKHWYRDDDRDKGGDGTMT